jgi:hypothetical protein
LFLKNSFLLIFYFYFLEDNDIFEKIVFLTHLN